LGLERKYLGSLQQKAESRKLRGNRLTTTLIEKLSFDVDNLDDEDETAPSAGWIAARESTH
jgi:hypothetical protein